MTISSDGQSALVHPLNLDSLRLAIGKCDDQAGHHLIWIDQQGRIWITRLPAGAPPNQWISQHQSRIAERLEVFARGHGYVGDGAAADAKHMEELLSRIREAREEAGF